MLHAAPLILMHTLLHRRPHAVCDQANVRLLSVACQLNPTERAPAKPNQSPVKLPLHTHPMQPISTVHRHYYEQLKPYKCTAPCPAAKHHMHVKPIEPPKAVSACCQCRNRVPPALHGLDCIS